MRLTYSISVLIILAAIAVAYKWLPARAAASSRPSVEPEAASDGELVSDRSGVAS